MRLIISVANEQSQLHVEFSNYNDLQRFIKQKFNSVPSRFSITYQDKENEQVGLCSKQDFDLLVFNSDKNKPTTIYIKENCSYPQEQDDKEQDQLYSQTYKSNINQESNINHTKNLNLKDQYFVGNINKQRLLFKSMLDDESKFGQLLKHHQNIYQKKLSNVQSSIRVDLNKKLKQITKQISVIKQSSIRGRNLQSRPKIPLTKDDLQIYVISNSFQLAEIFGQQPQSYQQFLRQNQNKSTSQLIQIYHQYNPYCLDQKVGPKMMSKAKQLHNYFGKFTFDDVLELVKEQPSLGLKEYVDIVRHKEIEHMKNFTLTKKNSSRNHSVMEHSNNMHESSRFA